MSSHVEANVERFSGFAEWYDKYRPQPPVMLMDILTQLLGNSTPSCVVDLGCGTGLSTRIWANRASQVIGIEPNPEMRQVAEALTSEPSIRYQYGVSTCITLPDESADIVVCSQSFHWMEPEETLAEVSRILRSGGIFATVDCDWPPTVNWQAEQAYRVLSAKVDEMEKLHGINETVKKWAKNQHLENIKKSGRFRYTKEIVVHNAESGDASRLVGLAMSQGSLQGLLKAGLSEDEIGVTDFRKTLAGLLGETEQPWYFSYRIRLGVK